VRMATQAQQVKRVLNPWSIFSPTGKLSVGRFRKQYLTDMVCASLCAAVCAAAARMPPPPVSRSDDEVGRGQVARRGGSRGEHKLVSRCPRLFAHHCLAPARAQPHTDACLRVSAAVLSSSTCRRSATLWGLCFTS